MTWPGESWGITRSYWVPRSSFSSCLNQKIRCHCLHLLSALRDGQASSAVSEFQRFLRMLTVNHDVLDLHLSAFWTRVLRHGNGSGVPFGSERASMLAWQGKGDQTVSSILRSAKSLLSRSWNFSLVSLRLKPTLLERTYQEMDMNFR